ncbi:hypothetical protein CB1_000221024 [Camelus ferus]|nr:hypothetical protein CB1_000221024 [Camelus ferus]
MLIWRHAPAIPACSVNAGCSGSPSTRETGMNRGKKANPKGDEPSRARPAGRSTANTVAETTPVHVAWDPDSPRQGRGEEDPSLKSRRPGLLDAAQPPGSAGEGYREQQRRTGCSRKRGGEDAGHPGGGGEDQREDQQCGPAQGVQAEGARDLCSKAKPRRVLDRLRSRCDPST